MAVDRKPSAFSLYLRERRRICVTAPGGSSLVAGRTTKGPVSSDTLLTANQAVPLSSHGEGQSRSPRRGHTSLQSPRLNMTWTGITKERTYVQQTGHWSPNSRSERRRRCWCCRIPAQAGMEWLCLTGSSSGPGTERAVPNCLQLNCRKL